MSKEVVWLIVSQYRMDFQMSGECSLGSGGPCVSEGNCPKAYTGTDTNSGRPSTCLGDNVDVSVSRGIRTWKRLTSQITITFC